MARESLRRCHAVPGSTCRPTNSSISIKKKRRKHSSDQYFRFQSLDPTPYVYRYTATLCTFKPISVFLFCFVFPTKASFRTTFRYELKYNLRRVVLNTKHNPPPPPPPPPPKTIYSMNNTIKHQTRVKNKNEKSNTRAHTEGCQRPHKKMPDRTLVTRQSRTTCLRLSIGEFFKSRKAKSRPTIRGTSL